MRRSSTRCAATCGRPIAAVLVDVHAHINDPAFAAEAVRRLLGDRAT